MIITDPYIYNILNKIKNKIKKNTLILSTIDLSYKKKILNEVNPENIIIIESFEEIDFNKIKDNEFESVVLIGYLFNRLDKGKEFLFFKNLFNKIKYNNYLYILDYVSKKQNNIYNIEFKSKDLSLLFEKFSKEKNTKIKRIDEYTWKTNEKHILSFFFNVVDGKSKTSFPLSIEEYRYLIENIFGSKLHLVWDKPYIPGSFLKRVNQSFLLKDETGNFCAFNDICYLQEYKKTNYLFLD